MSSQIFFTFDCDISSLYKLYHYLRFINLNGLTRSQAEKEEKAYELQKAKFEAKLQARIEKSGAAPANVKFEPKPWSNTIDQVMYLCGCACGWGMTYGVCVGGRGRGWRGMGSLRLSLMDVKTRGMTILSNLSLTL